MTYRESTVEFLGTFLLVITVVGSDIIAKDLSQGNTALAVPAYVIAAGSTLYVTYRYLAQFLQRISIRLLLCHFLKR